MSDDKKNNSGDPDFKNTTRRDMLGTITQLSVASLVALVAPRMQAVSSRQTQTIPPHQNGASHLPWFKIRTAAWNALKRGVNKWIAQSRVIGGKVNASTVFLPPGSLSSTHSFADPMKKAILKAGAPRDVAEAFAHVSWEVWDAWVKSYHATIHGAFPGFRAVPAPEAPETPMEPFPLRIGEATGAIGITTDIAEKALKKILEGYLEDPRAVQVIDEFSHDYRNSFESWYNEAELQNLTGSGRVPSWKVPYIPVGCVVNGEVHGSHVLEGPEFE